jgi:hypothetical protein
MLTKTPTDFAAKDSFQQSFAMVKNDNFGAHGFNENDKLTSQVVVLHGANVDGELSALIPLDGNTLGRIEALARFYSAQAGRAIPPDTRLTNQQRRRLRFLLQAIDGRINAATYREIANAIYGASRVADMPWKTSPLRDSVIALVRDGLEMVEGGYRQLLRHRRRNGRQNLHHSGSGSL